MNEQLVEALPRPDTSEAMLQMDERTKELCPYIGSLTTEQVAAYDSMVDRNRQAEHGPNVTISDRNELYDARMDEVKTTQVTTTTETEQRNRKKKTKKSESFATFGGLKVREGDQIDSTIEYEEPADDGSIFNADSPMPKIDPISTEKQVIEPVQATHLTEALPVIETDATTSPTKKELPKPPTIAEVQPDAVTVFKATRIENPATGEYADSQPGSIESELSVSELDSRLEAMIAEQLSLRPDQDTPTEAQATADGPESSVVVIDNNVEPEMLAAVETRATTTPEAVDTDLIESNDVYVETFEPFATAEKQEAPAIVIEAPQTTEDFADNLAQLYAQPAQETLTPAVGTEEDSAVATATTEAVASPARKITIETPPAVVEINTRLVDKLEALESEFEPEVAVEIQANLAEVVDTIDEIGALFEAAAAEGKIPDLTIVQKMETELTAQCRQLLERLGIEADDDSLRSFVRHLTLVHSAEKIQNAEVTGLISEEGTHESKYYGHYAWQRLKRFLRKPVDALAVRLGHYTLALHETA